MGRSTAYGAPFREIATLEPGVRGFARAGAVEPAVVHLDLTTATDDESHLAIEAIDAIDAIVLEVLPPDPATMDLAEAPRIVAGGAGLESPARFAELAAAAEALGASLGATRVVTDRGWVGHERQIGTTGVVEAISNADLTVLDAPSHRHLAYRPGVPIARALELGPPRRAAG
jgi:hypothetical protein